MSNANQKRYTIKIIKDINDTTIVRKWKCLERASDCFPQMYYEWCEPWWRIQSDDRELHIVMVEDDANKIVGIAPLCIELRLGLRVLRSYPVRSVDFYSFVVENAPRETEITETIIGYLMTFKSWDIVHLFNVNNRSSLFTHALENGYKCNPVTYINAANLKGLSSEEYLAKLSRDTRKRIRNKMRKLDKLGRVRLQCIEDSEQYLRNSNVLRSLYKERWSDDYSLPPDDEYYQCRNQAVMDLFDKNKMVLFILKVDSKIISCCLGFKHQSVFYLWKIVHDPDFGKLSPGILMRIKIIEELISRGYAHINFMSGDYSYKRQLAPQGPESINYELLACNGSFRGRIYLRYRLHWQDRLKKHYYQLLENRHVRVMKRRLELLRKKQKI